MRLEKPVGDFGTPLPQPNFYFQIGPQKLEIFGQSNPSLSPDLVGARLIESMPDILRRIKRKRLPVFFIAFEHRGRVIVPGADIEKQLGEPLVTIALVSSEKAVPQAVEETKAKPITIFERRKTALPGSRDKRRKNPQIKKVVRRKRKRGK